MEEGGETNFPMADNDKPVRTMKKCEQGLMVKAVRGSAVLWYNMHPAGLVSKSAPKDGLGWRRGVRGLPSRTGALADRGRFFRCNSCWRVRARGMRCMGRAT